MNKSNKDDISKLFIDFANKVRKLEMSSFQEIIENGFDIIPKKSKVGIKSSINEIDQFDIDDFIIKLEKCDTRESGIDLLDGKNLTKQYLESILKKLSIPVQKIDNITVLKDKIIEATIGFKIRSKAIQSYNEN